MSKSTKKIFKTGDLVYVNGLRIWKIRSSDIEYYSCMSLCGYTGWMFTKRRFETQAVPLESNRLLKLLYGVK